jgi:hypothetical protein
VKIEAAMLYIFASVFCVGSIGAAVWAEHTNDGLYLAGAVIAFVIGMVSLIAFFVVFGLSSEQGEDKPYGG